MHEEALPCNLEWRIDANDIPGLRAALKLFAILEQLSTDDSPAPKISDLADLIKSECFRLNDQDSQLAFFALRCRIRVPVTRS